MSIRFLPFNCSLLLLGQDIGGDAIRDIIGENNHRTEGYSHKGKRNAA